MHDIEPNKKLFDIEIYSHYFVAKNVTPRGEQILNGFARRYIQFGLVKVGRMFKRMPVKVFASKVVPKKHFRFHYGQYDKFIEYLTYENNLGVGDYSLAKVGMYPVKPLDALVQEGWEARDYQIPVIEYMHCPEPSHKKLVQLQAGKGKTFSALAALVKLNVRVMVFLKPQFIVKWIADFKKTITVTEEDICVVQGSSQLMKLITEAKDGELKYKVIIISNRTFQNWITAYEQNGDKLQDSGYDCNPEDLMPLCQVGQRLVDEVHMDFHLNFKIDLYTHVSWSNSLSATLLSDDKFIAEMQYIAYPQEMRYKGMEFDRYVDTTALLYELADTHGIRYTAIGSKNYSHIEYEKNFYRNRKLMIDYLTMIGDQVQKYYIEHRKPGDRCLVYGASIQFCTTLSEYLKKRFSNIDVRRYVEDDPYENLMEAEISVSTVLSAGTGHDIAGLITVILTVAISSSASNIQGFGRLRNLGDKPTRFIYFTCKDISKQVEYFEKKERLLCLLAKSTDTATIHTPIG